jgi:predicted dehydrogenase
MIGQGHAYALRLLAEDGEIRPVAAADLSEDAARTAQQICPFTSIGTDARAVIDHPEVEAVAIVTPTTTHSDLVRAALAAGKPFLCEKPLAIDFATVREMCADVERNAVTAQVGFHSRFHPVINELRALVMRGELGRPMGYVLRDDQYWPTGAVVPGHSSWRSERAQAGGGALLEHSIHSADILTWLFGTASRVYARTRNVFGYDVEDTAACTVEHASGVVGTILSIFNGVRGREERRLEVFFEQGAIEVTTDFLVGAPEDSFLVQRPDEPATRLDMADLRERYFSRAGIARRDFVVYLYPAARAFVAAARERSAASPGFTDALRAHALIEAAYRSAATGQPVELTGDLATGSSS